MISHIIPLVASFLSGGIMEFVLYNVFILGFVSCIPCIVRYIFQWR